MTIDLQIIFATLALGYCLGTLVAISACSREGKLK